MQPKRTPTPAGASSPASQRVPSPLTPTRTSRRVRERTAAESPTCVPLFFFSHPPTLLVRGSFWAMQRRRHHQRRARSSGSAQAFEGPVDRGRHCQQAAAAHARQQRHQPRAHLQQLLQRRWRRQLRQLPAAPPLEARGGSQCEPPDPGRLGPRSAGGCRRFNLQQPTIGCAAKGAHGPNKKTRSNKSLRNNRANPPDM